MKYRPSTNRYFLVGISLIIVLIGTLNDAKPLTGKQGSKDLRRIALIVGNERYKVASAALRRSINDATDMKTVLSDFGFQVDLELDVDYQRMEQVIDKFISKLGPETVGLFYYAGHGMQIDGENYLIPVDFSMKDEVQAKRTSYSVSVLNERMEGAKTKLNIIILDACRNNPFRSGRMLRGRGLAMMTAGVGTYIAFATGPNTIAEDIGDDRNGLFTKYLLQSFKQHPTCLNEIFDRAREAVYTASLAKQIPWVASSVIGGFCFTDLTSPSSSSSSSPSPCKGSSSGAGASFSIEKDYAPSGIMGDIDDVQIIPTGNSCIFEYATTGKGPHEWDLKYVNGELNPEPARFGGVFYLAPPNNFGTVCGGVNLQGFRRLKWEARSLGSDVEVEFIIGGIAWIWDEKNKRQIPPPYPDSMPRVSLGQKTLTPKWQTFEVDLSDREGSQFDRVVNGFSWLVRWSSNGVKVKADHSGPDQVKTFKFEIRNVRYER
jgi:hypothetical protein